MSTLPAFNPDWQKELDAMGQRARAAMEILGRAAPEQRTKALKHMAEKLREQNMAILKANVLDMQRAEGKLSKAMQDRLNLTSHRIEGIAAGLEAVAAQPDPVGKVLEEWVQPNGLAISRISVPLGVIGMIYESRPNVTAEAASIALRGGNAIILRCGSDCYESSKAIADVLRAALADIGLPEDTIQLVPTTDRAAVGALLQLSNYVDVIVPRGGRELIERVERESRIPLLRQYEGICHIFIDAKADFEKAVDITRNAKMRRVSICGAAECVLFDRAVVNSIAPAVIKDLLDHGCEVRGDDAIQKLDNRVKPASESDWGKEFLEPIMAARVVDGVEGAITHINRFGSGHTDSIITESIKTSDLFCSGVNSAIAMVNTSTQFADGGEFGFGGEVGIATGRLHARGPIGAAQLTSYKYIVRGNGHIRP
jgi:glutamate-5-semialdehyde dehydrogenase